LFVKHALQTLHAMLFNSETCAERSSILRSNEVSLLDLLAALMSDPEPARLSAAATIRVCTQGGAWYVVAVLGPETGIACSAGLVSL
jgi:hypothetical protein